MHSEINVGEAHQQQTAGAIYLDVRSVPEFEQGHPAGAYNVPLLHLDLRTHQKIPNPDFLEVVRANFTPDTSFVIGCQSGVRSAQACLILAQAGYRHVANVAGGFGGSMRAPGWRQCGLPVATAADPSRTYDALLAKAAAGNR